MKTKLLAVALVAGALIAPAEAGNGYHGGGGGGNVASARSGGGGGPSFRSMPSAARFSGGASFRSMPMRSFSGNRAIYSGQRFSSVAPRVQPSTAFHAQRFQPNVGASVARGNVYSTDRAPGFASSGNQSIANVGRQSNGQFRTRGNQFGNGFARNNNAIRNRANGQFANGNARLRADWRNHVFAQRSASWQRNWDRSRDHWWNGHRCHFFNGSWVIFDAGFSPWWPWGYPYDYYYGYGYGYPYNYGYYPSNYGYNGYDYGYDQSGAYDNNAYSQNGYGGQSDANSTVAAVQDRLAREGYYRGQIDGVLGPETRHAIVRFQSNHGLQVTGELSPDTLNAMGLQNYASY